jgi:hypothetical protein
LAKAGQKSGLSTWQEHRGIQTMIRPSHGKRVFVPFRLLLTIVVAFSFALPLPMFFAVEQAHAQEYRERRSIIDMIFRRNRPRLQVQRPVFTEPRKKRRPRNSVVRRNTPNSSNSSSRSSVVEVETAVEKAPDAKKVLVIGDFMASALADGLTTAVEKDPSIAIEKGTDGSSGLVRADHLDWPVTLETKIGELKPALVIVMIGTNDRQQMTVNGIKEKFRSDTWNAEYEKRVSALIAVMSKNKMPFIWTGLPAFQSPSLSADAATFNSFYRSKVEMAGGTFVDIWDGFADENGKFIASGSDMNGQPVRLRGSDGLSLTKAGKRKMAFYLEKDMRRLLGTDEIANLIRLDAANLPLEDAAKVPTTVNITSVPPISFMDPELDGSSALLDGNLVPKPSGMSPRDLLVGKGETGDAPEGRIDDYKWTPPAKPAG